LCLFFVCVVPLLKPVNQMCAPQAFEKEAEAERAEIGNRALRLLERRTNQLLRLWSVSRLARYVFSCKGCVGVGVSAKGNA
jgi:hypothetical protein